MLAEASFRKNNKIIYLLYSKKKLKTDISDNDYYFSQVDSLFSIDNLSKMQILPLTSVA